MLQKEGSNSVITRKYDLLEGDVIDIKKSPWIAIDTETLGLNILNRDRLCTIQIYNGHKTYIVQFPKAFSNSKASSSPKSLIKGSKNLIGILKGNQEKLFHYARFDLLAIYLTFGILCKNIICTKVLSKMARTNTDKHGLKNLINETLGININKQQQSSYWGCEDLSQAQRDYASKDVIYLREIYDKLKDILQREGRLALSQRVLNVIPCAVLCEAQGYDLGYLIHYI